MQFQDDAELRGQLQNGGCAWLRPAIPGTAEYPNFVPYKRQAVGPSEAHNYAISVHGSCAPHAKNFINCTDTDKFKVAGKQ